MSRSQPQPRLKPPPRPLFSCGHFRHCTDPVLSPTAAAPPPSSSASTGKSVGNTSPPPVSSSPPPPHPLAASHLPDPAPSSSSSSSSSASHSFTQWRFPLHHHRPAPDLDPRPAPPDPPFSGVSDAFRAADLHFASGARLPALRLLEHSLSPDPSPPGGNCACTASVMAGVVESLRDLSTARVAAKVLMALVLGEENRRLAVEMGAAGAAVVGAGEGGATAERALAALELICSTVEEGAEAVRSHSLAGAALAGAAEGMGGSGRDCAIGVMATVWGGSAAGAAPPEVMRAVVVALQGECGARGRRKGAQLLRALRESGRLDLEGEG